MNQTNRMQKYGNWALVTGASDGIGKAFAYELGKSSINHVLVARNRASLEQIQADLIAKENIQVQIIAADLSIPEDRKKVLEQTQEMDIGLFVAAAGFGTSGQFMDNTLEEELSMIDVNCRAVAEQTHVFANRFQKRGRGGIILFGSLVGFQGVPRAANYAATKAFIQTLAEGLHYELKPFGVDVLSVAPGPINSGFGKRANMKMGNGGTPEVVAKESLQALGKKITVRPGFLSKFLEFSLTVPRPFRTRIMAIVMGGMTKHRS